MLCLLSPRNMHINVHKLGYLWILWYLSLWFWRAHFLPRGRTTSVLWIQAMSWARKFCSMFKLSKILHLLWPFMHGIQRDLPKYVIPHLDWHLSFILFTKRKCLVLAKFSGSHEGYIWQYSLQLVLLPSYRTSGSLNQQTSRFMTR